MPGNNELRLKFGGYVDRQELKNDVREAINEVNKENSGSGKGVKIPVYDIEDIKEQGLKVIKATEDVEKQIRRTFKPIKGEIDVKSITNANNEIDQYNIKIVERNQIIDQYILKLRQVKELDGSTYPAFVQTRLTSSDNGNGSLLVKQTKELTKARAEIENLMNQFLTGNGKKILGDDSRVNEILNQLADAEKLVNKLSTTAGRNPRDKMEDVTTLINKIKAQANDYYEVEEAEKKAAKQREEDNQKAIKSTEEQTAALKKYKAEVNDLLDTYVRTNGTKLLTKDKNSSDIQNRSVELLGDINKLNKTAGLNTPEQMEYIKDTIGLLKKEADEYYRIEKNQKSLIDSQTKEVEAVQNKVTALSNRYIDKTGSNQLFDTKNIEDVNGQISKIMAKVSELRANAGKASYNFDANISVLNNMYDALEKNAKGYYKLETEQRKSSELFQKQDKDVQQYLLDIQKVKDTALNSQSGKRLLDEENIKAVRSELAQAENILRNMINTHKRGDIIDTKNVDSFIIKMKQVDAQVSTLRDKETVQMAAEKTVQSQLNALSRVEQKIKDIRLQYEDGFLKESSVSAFNLGLKNVEDELDKLKAKAGTITEEEMRNLTSLSSELKTTASILADGEKEQLKSIADYETQSKVISGLEAKLQSLKDKAFIGGNALKDAFNIEETRKSFKEVSSMIDKLKTNRGTNNVLAQGELDAVDNKLKEIGQDISVFRDMESLVNKDNATVESQTDALNAYDQKLKDIIHKYSTGGNQLFNADNIKAFNVEVLKIQNELDRLGANVGNISKAESRNLSNMFSELRRTADEYANMEKAERKVNEESVKSSKAYEDQAIKLAKLEQSVRSIVDSSLKGGKALIDPNNVDYVEGKLNSINTYINGMFAGHAKGKLIPDEVFALADVRLKELQQDVSVFRDEETLIRNATKSMEDQLNTLSRFKENLKNLRASYLVKNGSSELMDLNHIKELQNAVNRLHTIIDSMRQTMDSNDKESYRNLTSEYNAVVRLAQGFANVEKAQAKNDEALRKQANTLIDYQRGIRDLYNLNLDPTVQGSLKNQNNINNIARTITQVNTELSHMYSISSNGQLVPVDQMDRFVKLYKDLNSQITYARRQEGLENTIAKDTQAQINKFSEMERSLDSFYAKYYGEGSPTKLSDRLYIDETSQKLQNLLNLLSVFKANAGNVTDNQINAYKNLKNELDILAQRYASLEAIQKKENQTIEDQKFILDAYYLEIKRIRETTLNPTSASSLLASDDIQKVIDGFDKFEQRYNDFRTRNNSGSLINKSELKETDLILKEINQDIKIIGTEMRKEMTADTSMQHMVDQANVYRQSIVGLIQELQNRGMYVGKLRDEVIGLVKELAQIKVPKDVTSFNLHLSAIEKKVGNVKAAMKAAFETEQLQQKLQLFSSQVQGYMQQNTRAAMLFKSSFEQIQKGISNASTSEDLLRLQNDFKILQQNINNAGKAGQTFGERMSAALKKFMMWTGMTNTVMYLVRSIRQMITHTKELDSAMVSLKKVTDETDAVYTQMFENASEKAKELNTSIKNIINSTAEFAKLGYNVEDAESLAAITNIYANVGEISDIDEATASIVSTMKAFNIEAQDAITIVDKFNAVGNAMPISSQGIGEALKRSASSLAMAGNDINESIGLIVGANSVVK